MSDLAENTLDTKLIVLAHEIAMDIRPVPDILQSHGINATRWGMIQRDPHFQAVLASKSTEWASATNTISRTKLKAAAMVEMNLDQFQIALADEEVTPLQKLQIMQFMSKLGGMTEERREGGALGGGGVGQFQVKIYLGGKDNAPMVIEGDRPQEVLTVD